MPLLAQISTGVIEAATDAGVAVLALIAIIVLGFGAWRLGDRLFATVDKLTVAAQDAQEKAEGAQKSAQAAQDALTAIASAVQTSMNANTSELKAQTSLLADIRERIETSGKATTKAITERLDAHDTQAREGIARIEATLAALRDEVGNGNKAHNGEVLNKLNEVLAEIRSLKDPPPSEPKVIPELRVA